MNTFAMVQHAVRCLQDLDQYAPQPQSVPDISRRQDVPLKECLRVLHRLADAGIVRFDAEGGVALLRALETLAHDEILNAVWVTEREKPRVISGMTLDLGRFAAIPAADVARC